MKYYLQFIIRNFRFLPAVLLVFVFVNFSNAQSGRRIKTQPEKPAPENPQPEQKPEQKPVATVQPLHKLKILSDTKTYGLSRFYFPDRMPRWVTDRLQNSLLLEVSSGPESNLGEAKKIAKNETDVFIVLVELDEDRFSEPSRSGRNTQNPNLAVKYYVFEPGTGKIKFSGLVMIYAENLTNRPILDSNRLCYPQVTGNDLSLLESSIETAERIMSGFKIPIPPYKCASNI